MIKPRVIASLVVRQGSVVQSRRFGSYRPIGSPGIAMENLSRWGVDEIVLTDISATPQGRAPDLQALERWSVDCMAPLTVGGGVRTVADVGALLHAGADKVLVNTGSFECPTLVQEAAQRFGSQCLVVSLDARQVSLGRYEAFVRGGRVSTRLTIEEAAERAVGAGAGEVFVRSIEHDGVREGFDLELLSRVLAAVHVPVVISGGAGRPEHFAAALELKPSGVAAGNLFQHSELSVTWVKAYLRAQGAAVRMEDEWGRREPAPDVAGRPNCPEPDQLERLRFEHLPEEVI